MMPTFVKSHMRKSKSGKVTSVRATTRVSAIRGFLNAKAAVRRHEKANHAGVSGAFTRLERAKKNLAAIRKVLIDKTNRGRRARGRQETNYIPTSVMYTLEGGKKKSQAITKANIRAASFMIMKGRR